MSKKHRHSPPILHHARRMRREPTKAEKALWQKLRRRQLGDYKFRRQHPIGNYIVDFYCAETQLIVEVDGDVHAHQKEKDGERTAVFEAQGYRVIRFWNGQVLQEMDTVLTMILGLVIGRVSHFPSPQPSPQKGEGVKVPSPCQGEG